MAIKPICNHCGKELSEFGAILLGPPSKKNTVAKLHICKPCYKIVVKEFKS